MRGTEVINFRVSDEEKKAYDSIMGTGMFKNNRELFSVMRECLCFTIQKVLRDDIKTQKEENAEYYEKIKTAKGIEPKALNQYHAKYIGRIEILEEMLAKIISDIVNVEDISVEYKEYCREYANTLIKNYSKNTNKETHK